MLPKTVVLHYKKLSDRKFNIIHQLENHGFTDYSFYEEYDQDELTQPIISALYDSKSTNPIKWKHKVSLWGNNALNYHNPQLTLPEISLTIKLGKVIQELSQQSFYYCIVLEDDAILCKNFIYKFNKYLSLTPPDWDVIYFGECYNLHANDMVFKQLVYHKNHPASRGAGAILIKQQAIKDLASSWFPFNLVSDWELAYQHYYHKHQVYWWEPTLVKQGSETGLFKSTLR